MLNLPRIEGWENIDYLRMKTTINDLPEPLKSLFIQLLKEIEKLDTQVKELNGKACVQCKYFD